MTVNKQKSKQDIPESQKHLQVRVSKVFMADHASFTGANEETYTRDEIEYSMQKTKFPYRFKRIEKHTNKSTTIEMKVLV